MSDPVERSQRSPSGAATDEAMEAAGEASMPSAADPMTQATGAMQRAALERPIGVEMPIGGMPEHEVEAATNEGESGGTA